LIAATDRWHGVLTIKPLAMSGIFLSGATIKLMSAFGTKRTFQSAPAMSAFGGKADIAISGRHVCF
jgi:hypothetical protein